MESVTENEVAGAMVGVGWERIAVEAACSVLVAVLEAAEEVGGLQLDFEMAALG